MVSKIPKWLGLFGSSKEGVPVENIEVEKPTTAPSITRFDPNDMPDQPKRHDAESMWKRPEFDAVRALKEGEAIKFRCSWKHHNAYQCGSFVSIARIFKKGDYLGTTDYRGEASKVPMITIVSDSTGKLRRLREVWAPWKGSWMCKDEWVYVNRVCTHLEKLGFGATND